LGVPVVRSAVSETTALGAAYLAGLAIGFWKSKVEIFMHWKSDKIFEPQMERARAQELRDKWNEAVSCSKDWDKR
jgi:glycerol kinase